MSTQLSSESQATFTGAVPVLPTTTISRQPAFMDNWASGLFTRRLSMPLSNETASATLPLKRGACEEHVWMLTSPLCLSTGAVSWKQPKFGHSNGLSSSRPSNPDVKQAHGEAELVHREDGRQLTGRGKLDLLGASSTRQRCPFRGPLEGDKRCHAYWWSMPSGNR